MKDGAVVFETATCEEATHAGVAGVGGNDDRCGAPGERREQCPTDAAAAVSGSDADVDFSVGRSRAAPADTEEPLGSSIAGYGLVDGERDLEAAQLIDSDRHDERIAASNLAEEMSSVGRRIGAVEVGALESHPLTIGLGSTRRNRERVGTMNGCDTLRGRPDSRTLLPSSTRTCPALS